MSKSERLAALAKLKDEFTVYMPFHDRLEQRFYFCLLSAYRMRSYGVLNESDPAILSVTDPITKSVQDASLIGTAGSGKSTAVRLMLDHYPKAIMHNLDGHQYVQVPILEITAKEGDIKSVFLDLAKRLDMVVGVSLYADQMRKMGTVAKMELYLSSLIQIFHVGAIVIDEIQFALKKKITPMFNHILSITSATGVAVIIVGTESAITSLNRNAWFSRRFSQLGRISSDIQDSNTEVMETVAKIIWDLQYTKKKYDNSREAMSALVDSSCNNIDFLSTIFIKTQYLCIESEGKENLELNADTIRKAAKMFPIARKLLKDGREKVELEYLQEKQSSIAAIESAAQKERELEQKALMAAMESTFEKKKNLTSEIIARMRNVGFTDDKQTERIINKKLNTDKDFINLDRSQQAKIVIAELSNLETRGAKQSNKSAKPKPESSKSAQIQLTMREDSGDHGADMLQAAIS